MYLDMFHDYDKKDILPLFHEVYQSRPKKVRIHKFCPQYKNPGFTLPTTPQKQYNVAFFNGTLNSPKELELNF